MRASLPKNICIDKFKSTADAEGAMSCILANPNTRKTIEMLENRKLDSLIEYFRIIKNTMDTSITNVIIEGINNKIKVIKNSIRL